MDQCRRKGIGIRLKRTLGSNSDAADNPLTRAGYQAIQGALYGSEALDYADITYAQAEATGLGAGFRGLAGIKAARPWLARGIGFGGIRGSRRRRRILTLFLRDRAVDWRQEQ